MTKISSSEKGITLIEVLLTLVIMSIVSGVIYSVFATGLKLYQKIGIEAQFRDDADYIATMILNQMYNSPPDYIKEVKDGSTTIGIEMVRYEKKKVDGYLVEDSTAINKKLRVYYQDEKFFIESINPTTNTVEEKNEIATESSKLTTNGSGTESSISLTCSKENTNGECQHGTINLNIVIGDKHEFQSNFLKTDPLELPSSFGF